jgi:hypothetical protein
MLKKTSILCAIIVLAYAGSCSAADAPKYDMSKFKTIVQDTVKLVKSGDYAGAQKKIQDVEGQWDDGTKDLKAADRKVWNTIDKQMDVAIEACKAAKDAATGEKAEKALADFLTKLDLAEQVK